jgi:CheY-like chemotaxis protein
MTANTTPPVLVAHDRLMPGAQLVNLLRELGYAPRVVGALAELAAAARESGPIFALVDLEWDKGDVMLALRELRSDSAIAHLPVLAFAAQPEESVREAALAAGATLVAAGDAVARQLPQLVERLLHVD